VNGIEVVLRDVHKDEMKDFEEAFITSTTREVCPVIQVDDLQIGDGKVGPVTKRLIQLFSQAKSQL